MDILDILLDILLKPPQPFIGLFFTISWFEGNKSCHGGLQLPLSLSEITWEIVWSHFLLLESLSPFQLTI